MTSVGIERDGIALHSCPSCGRHAWTRGGRQLDRQELLEALRSVPVARAARRPVAPRGTASADVGDLLQGFTVHGTSS